MASKPKLCIISLYAYPLFNPEHRQTHFGGWEVRISLIAKNLAKRGQFEVSIIVWDHGQPHIEQREGVTFYAWSGKFAPIQDLPDHHQTPVDESPASSTGVVLLNHLTPPAETMLPEAQASPTTPKQSRLKRQLRAKLPWQVWWPLRAFYWGINEASKTLYRGWREALRWLYWGLRDALKALSIYLVDGLNMTRNGFGLIGDYFIWNETIAIYDEIDADIYLVPGNHHLAAEVAYYCQKRRKKYVFLAGSDLDYDPAYKTAPDKADLYGVPGYLKLYAIEKASLHLVQNEHQVQLLQQGYTRSSILIRNPMDIAPLFLRNPETKVVLWVGSSDDQIKRPDLILSLARKLPEYAFVVIMVPAIPEVHQRCLEQAKCLPNVTIVGRTPFHEIERYFADAKLFVNTSVFEGFPNTFLQAAKYGVPIIAAKVDPGEMLSRYGCGISCNDDLELLERNVRLLMTNPKQYAQASACCLDYVRTYHDKDKIIPQYEQALISIL